MWAASTSSTRLVVLDRGQGHGQLDRDREAAVLAGDQVHLGVDLDVADLELAAAGDGGQGALEAGGVADREELLGVRPPLLAAHLGRRAQVDLEHPVGGAAVAGDPAAGDVGLGGVELLAHRSSLAAGLLGAALAAPAQDDVVVGDVEADLVGEAVDRALEGRVLEGDHAAAVAADRVVVMVAAGLDPLVAGGAAADLEALDEAELLELLEGAVDAGPAAGGSSAAQLVVELERGDRAIVAGERLDHRRAGAAAAQAGGLQRRQRVLGPTGVAGSTWPSQPIVALARGRFASGPRTTASR